MSLPEYIEAKDIPTGSNEPCGIICKLKSQVSNVLTYIEATSTSAINHGQLSYIVSWEDLFQTKNDQNSYVQIEFKDRYIFPTHYSFRGWDGSYSYHKEWDIYGYNSLNNDEELITTNTSADSTFCSPGTYCSGKTWGTFAIQNPKKAYRYLKIKLKTPSNPNFYAILLSGFEVFGIYSKTGVVPAYAKPRRTYCFMSYPIARHFPIQTIMKITFICSY